MSTDILTLPLNCWIIVFFVIMVYQAWELVSSRFRFEFTYVMNHLSCLHVQMTNQWNKNLQLIFCKHITKTWIFNAMKNQLLLSNKKEFNTEEQITKFGNASKIIASFSKVELTEEETFQCITNIKIKANAVQ